jgi:putative colanic acid biosynthesis acetyltransferase WcaF
MPERNPGRDLVRLSEFDNRWYTPGRSLLVRTLWFFVGCPLVRSTLLPFGSWKAGLLRLFGARLGRGIVIKPGVRIKHPWLLEIGDHSWIGEDAWIDNLAPVTIGRNACLSQGVYLCTGNHDWSDPEFGLIVKPIRVENGAWVGAKSVIAPGVVVGAYAVICAGSVVNSAVPPMQVQGGNPAVFLKTRKIRQEVASLETFQPRGAVSI